MLACGASLLLAACGSEAPPPPRPRDAAAAASLPARLAAADPAHGASLFRRCAACHTLSEGAPDTDGPNLHAVVGNPVAQRRPRFAYTAALTAVGGIWTPDRLDAWLTNPRSFAPGTSMTFAGLPDAQDRADVIEYLIRNN
jgi:cytochrome c